MKDKEKLDLIGCIISGFWDNHSDEEIKNNASAIVSAIATVVDFGGKEDG